MSTNFNLNAERASRLSHLLTLLESEARSVREGLAYFQEAHVAARQAPKLAVVTGDQVRPPAAAEIASQAQDLLREVATNLTNVGSLLQRTDAAIAECFMAPVAQGAEPKPALQLANAAGSA